MADDEQLNALIREIAEKHHIAVGRNDPILVLHTINERLMKNSAASQEEILGQFRQELESVAQQWGFDAKEKAERILSAALTASQEAMRKLLLDGAKATTEILRKEIQESLTTFETPIRETKRVAWMNMGASVLTLLAAIIVLCVLLH
jgi:hypothetical protein